MGNALSLTHILIIAVVVLVIFGRGKVASLMGEVGKGITAFKKGVSEGNSANDAPAANPPEIETAPGKTVEKDTR